MRQHSICYHSADVYNKFGVYTCAYYISVDVKHKIDFIMIKICSLKIGEAGNNIKLYAVAFANILNPAKLCI